MNEIEKPILDVCCGSKEYVARRRELSIRWADTKQVLCGVHCGRSKNDD